MDNLWILGYFCHFLNHSFQWPLEIILYFSYLKAKSFESFENISAPKVSTALTNKVLKIDKIAVNTYTVLVLSIPTVSEVALLFIVLILNT